MITGWKRLERSKIYDVAAAAPLILFYGWIVWRAVPIAAERFAQLGAGAMTLAVAADTAALCLSVVFSGLLVVLLFVRRVPAGKSAGVAPRLAAVAGTFLVLLLVRLPTITLPPWLFVLSVVLILFGTVASIVSLAWLGRSFSIMPEARRLVTAGPYAFVRHPLYLFEEIAVVGLMLQHVQPWSALIFVAQFGFQLVRIDYEERVLSATFPDYRSYAAGRARLIPGLY
jgi:protein-S-isoprenylcysteine O-methyltransferase Ste14